MAFKIAYGAGHYRYTAGKRLPKELDPEQTREWILNDRVARYFAEAAKQYEGVELLRVDDPAGEKGIAIADRCKAANNWGADFCFAIHHNAAGKVFNGGGVVSYWAKSKDEVYAKAIYNAVIAAGGIKGNRATPIPKSMLYVPRNCKAPCVLLECGFMDSRIDAPIILTEAYSKLVAYAAMEGIAKVAGLKKKSIDTVEQPPQPVQQPESGKTMYRVRKSWANKSSQLGAFTVLQYAKNACKNGYAIFDDEGNALYYRTDSNSTLWGVAKNFLGYGTRYPEIQEMNGMKNTVVRKGMLLKLPKK